MKRAIRWIGIAGLIFVLLLITGGLGMVFVFEVPITLAFGWIAFLGRVLPQMQPSLSGIVVAGVLAAAVLYLGQWLAGSFYNRPPTTEAAGRRWPLRWTLLGLGGLVLVFCLTIASAGIIHQVGWLASSEQRLIQSSWDTPAFHLRRAKSDTKTAVTQAIVYANDKHVYPTSLKVLRDAGYANVPDIDHWGNPYVLAPVLTSGAKPRDGDDVYIYSKGPKGTGTYPRPFTLNTREDGSVGYSSLYGPWPRTGE